MAGRERERERTLRRRMSVPTLAHSLNIRTEADDRAERDASCDGGGQGMREEEGRCFACRLDRLTSYMERGSQ